MASEFEIEVQELSVSSEGPFELYSGSELIQRGSSLFVSSPWDLSFKQGDSTESISIQISHETQDYQIPTKAESNSVTLYLRLSATPVWNPSVANPLAPYTCRYLNNISVSDSHYENTKNILSSLEEMMGENYQKMLDDVMRPPSPSRSPQKKLSKGGNKTPAKTPSKSPYKRSFSGLNLDQGGVVEIPCNEEIFMDKVSGKDAHSLMLVVAALLAKRRMLKASDDEEAVVRSIMENNQKASSVMKAAFEETKAQILAEKEEINGKIKDIQDNIRGLEEKKREILQKNKELDAEKAKVVKSVRESMENIELLRKVNVSESENLLARILSTRQEVEKSESDRKNLQNEYSKYLADFRSEVVEKDREVSKRQDLLNKSITEYNQKDVFLTHLIQDNSKLQSQVLDHTSKLVVKMSQNDRIALLAELITKDSGAVNELKQKLSEMVSHFEEIREATNKSLLDIQFSKEAIDRKQDEVKGEIEEKAKENSELAENIHKLKESLKEIRSLYEKTAHIEQNFANLQKRMIFSYENKEHAVREMKYLSDLILHLTSCYTSAHRSFNKATALLEQKSCEVVTIHKALEELKKKYPVYFPIKEDPLDLALGNYLNQRDSGLAVPFIREGGGVYVFGTRKILVKYERSKLTVKVGGGFLPIEEFIHAYSDIEVEKFMTKCQELSPKTKKFLGKWVGGFVENCDNTKKLKEMLVQAAEDHKYSVSYAVKSPERTPSPARKSRTSFS